jgi:hypothetical protein
MKRQADVFVPRSPVRKISQMSLIVSIDSDTISSKLSLDCNEMHMSGESNHFYAWPNVASRLHNRA